MFDLYFEIHFSFLVANPFGHGTQGQESIADAYTTTISNIFQSTQGLWISLCYCFLNREVRGLVDRRWEHSSLKRTVSRRLSSVASRFTQETESNWSRSPSENNRHSRNNHDNNNNRYQSGDRIVQPDLTTPFIQLEKSQLNNPHLGNQMQFSLLENNNNNNSDNSSTSTFPNNSNNNKQHTTTPLQTN